MLKIIGIAEVPCCMTGKAGNDVLQVRFDDRQFAGVIHMTELQRMIERKSKTQPNAQGGKNSSQTSKREEA